MPSNNDLPIVPSLGTLSASDRVLVYDVSLQPNGERSMTVSALLEQAVGLLPTSASGLAVGKLWLNSGVLTRVMA